MIKYVASLPLETVVDVKGVLVEASVKSCTQVGGSSLGIIIMNHMFRAAFGPSLAWCGVIRSSIVH